MNYPWTVRPIIRELISEITPDSTWEWTDTDHNFLSNRQPIPNRVYVSVLPGFSRVHIGDRALMTMTFAERRLLRQQVRSLVKHNAERDLRIALGLEKVE